MSDGLHSDVISWHKTHYQCCVLDEGFYKLPFKAKEKYRGMFEIQKSGDKTSSGEIGLDIRTHASPVADALWKPIFGEMSDSVKC